MTRYRKTSTQPKRKLKKPVKIVKAVYPEYLQTFIQEVEYKTPFKVKIDQYEEGAAYHVGVNQIVGRVQRCIWMVGFATGPEHLQPFWTSLAMKDVTIKST